MPAPGEMKTPELVFQKLFDCYHLHEINESLKEIKQWLIHKNYPHHPGSREHDNVLFFFEKMQLLVDAVWIFEKRRLANQEKITGNTSGLFHLLYDKVDALYDASVYLHSKNQGGLCCYFLNKTVRCAYNALLMTTTGTSEPGDDLEGLANMCSGIFNGLPNPFTTENGDSKYLRELNNISLQKAFSTDLKIDDNEIKSLLRQVNLIRRDVCEYYESKVQES